MPLTARFEDGSVLDATGDDPRWSLVHRNREARLLCPACSSRVVAKQMHRSGMRFFAHHHADPRCHLSRETLAHRLLKLELATACRAAGWHAELEVPAHATTAASRGASSRQGPGGHLGEPPMEQRGWRADVLATARDGQRRAFEAQLSSIPASAVRARHHAMSLDGVPAVWFTQTHPGWAGLVPWLRVELMTAGERWPDARRSGDGWVALRVTAGVASFQRGRWLPYNPAAPLASVVAELLDGRLVWHQPDPTTTLDRHGDQRGDQHGERRGFFVTPDARDLEAEHLATEPARPPRAEAPRPRDSDSTAGAWSPGSTPMPRDPPREPLPDIVYPSPPPPPPPTGGAAPVRRARTREQTELLRPALDYVSRHFGVEPAHAEPHADQGYGKALIVRGRVVAILCPDPDALPPRIPPWMRLLVGDAVAAAALRAAAPDHTVIVVPTEPA